MTPAQIREKLGMGEDKVYAVIGQFDSPEELLDAGRKIHGMGYTSLDAMTPFPVHGIEKALGIPESKLGWIVIWFSILGAASALGLIYYVGAVNYPLVIGGKPFFDFTFSIPVTFELTILFSAFASLIGMLALNGLPRLYHPAFKYSQTHRASDDKFLLVIEADDPKFNAQKCSSDMRNAGGACVEVVEG
jgi:Protein of unknown function (DUF3341)